MILRRAFRFSVAVFFFRGEEERTERNVTVPFSTYVGSCVSEREIRGRSPPAAYYYYVVVLPVL